MELEAGGPTRKTNCLLRSASAGRSCVNILISLTNQSLRVASRAGRLAMASNPRLGLLRQHDQCLPKSSSFLQRLESGAWHDKRENCVELC